MIVYLKKYFVFHYFLKRNDKKQKLRRAKHGNRKTEGVDSTVRASFEFRGAKTRHLSNQLTAYTSQNGTLSSEKE